MLQEFHCDLDCQVDGRCCVLLIVFSWTSCWAVSWQSVNMLQNVARPCMMNICSLSFTKVRRRLEHKRLLPRPGSSFTWQMDVHDCCFRLILAYRKAWFQVFCAVFMAPSPGKLICLMNVFRTSDDWVFDTCALEYWLIFYRFHSCIQWTVDLIRALGCPCFQDTFLCGLWIVGHCWELTHIPAARS